MQCLQRSAFGGSQLQGRQARSGVEAVGRAPTVVVRASQDLQGKVVSTGMQRSCVVAVERLQSVDCCQKRVRITKRFIAEDDGSFSLNVGDYVRLEGCKPLSKSKRFRVAEVLRKSE